MKLGIFYTVFDGEELLSGSIDQIYEHVDHILICFQSISNKGEINNNLEGELVSMLMGREKIKFLEFHPIHSLNLKEMERQKHNFALQQLKNLGCTHFIMSACDHYYVSDDFAKAKIKALNYDVTLTNMNTYFKHPEWQLTPIENYQMPFICKMHPNTEISKLEYNGFKTDPSVRINTRNTLFLFPNHDIILHHYSMIRKNVRLKFRNAAIFKRSEDEISEYVSEYENYNIQENKGVKYFGGRKINIVNNIFNISLPE